MRVRVVRLHAHIKRVVRNKGFGRLFRFSINQFYFVLYFRKAAMDALLVSATL